MHSYTKFLMKKSESVIATLKCFLLAIVMMKCGVLMGHNFTV